MKNSIKLPFHFNREDTNERISKLSYKNIVLKNKKKPSKINKKDYFPIPKQKQKKNLNMQNNYSTLY